MSVSPSVRVALLACALAIIAIFVGCNGGGGGGDALDHLVVAPDGATIDTATSVHVRATGVTKSGRLVEVGTVTWTPSVGAIDPTDNFSSTSAGDALITAAADGVEGTATIHVVAPGSATVKVVDAATGADISGALVSLVTTTAGGSTTAANGTATLSGLASGGVDVFVRANNYYPVTAYGVKVRDMRIPMRSSVAAASGGFQGVINFETAYDRNEPPSGSLWVGFAGPAIKGNILSFGFDSLLGENRTITVAGLTVDAPSNVFVFGVTSDYVASAPPGGAAAFALGGEITLQEITDIIANTGSSDLGAILAEAIPIFTRFFYTVETGLTVTANQTLQGVDMVLDTKLSKTAKLAVPPRPVTDPNPVVIAAVDLGPAVGFIPAGLGVVEGETALSTSVKVPPLSGAFAGSTYMFLVVSQEGGTGSSSSDQQVAVLSRGNTDIGSVVLPDFFVPPVFAGFTGTGPTRTFAFPASTEADFDFHTFTKNITVGTGGSAVTTSYQWDVITAAEATGFVLPIITGTNGARTGGDWVVQTLGLESQTYESILTPSSPVDMTNYFYDANRIVLTNTGVD